MDNEDVVYENNENDSTSNLSDNADSADTVVSDDSKDGSKTSYNNRDNLHNRTARRMDNFSNGLDRLSKGINNFANKRLGKNPDSRLGNTASKLGGRLNNASNRINRVNSALQGVNNKVNTAEDVVEDPLGTTADVAKDKVADKAKEKIGEVKDKVEVVAKEGIKKLLLPLLPWIIGIALLLSVAIIIVSIIIIILGGGTSTDGDGSIAGGNGTCTYNVNGQQISNLKVRLLNCGGYTPLSSEGLIDFEDYILGVVYQEVGDAPIEALKVQAIVARSFSLTRPKEMGNNYGLSLAEENGQWVLALRSCTNDQVFCNADKGCWSLRTGGQTSDSNSDDWPNCTVYSGNDTTKPWHKGPLAQDSLIRQAVEETKGMVLEDSKGNIVHTNFKDSNQKKWVKMANSGKDAFEILTKDYGSGKKISSPNCTSGEDSSIASADVAAITNWDQKTAWKNLIGKSTDERRPSVSKSTMDSRVTQVEVPMRKWTGTGSDPKTNTKKVMQSITVNKAIAPLWKAFFEDVYNNAPDFVIGSFDGCYVYRSVTGGGSLSAHAYGVACDINASTPGNGYKTTSYSKEKWSKLPNNRAKYQVVYKGSKVVQIAHKYTLVNGSDWNGGGNDAMHFSFIRDWTRSQIIACKGKTSC